ncbi:MAG: nucleotidyltransferase family protein [Gammaproteobacteria bacterium]
MEVTVNREDIIQQIRKQHARLAEFGVASLALFGSVERDETRPDKDVDILVRFDGKATFDQYMDLKLFLEDLLGRHVDLVTERALRDEIRPQVERELLRVA